jgi:hypothetical protein
MAKQTNPRQLLETASATLGQAPKVSFSTNFITDETSEQNPATSSSVSLHVQCDVDREARKAHMVTIESYAHTSATNEYYYDGDVEYIRFGNGWRRSALSAAAAERIYGRGGAFQLLGIESIGTPELNAAQNGRTTLTFRVPAATLRAAAPAAENAPQAVVGDATVQVELAANGRTIDLVRVESTATRAVGDDQLTGRQTTEVHVRILSPSFQIVIPESVRANAFTVGAEELALISQDAAFACWCTGCAACTACLACLACLGCLACIFPPALVPVTATSAGAAIASAVAAATAISTGVASGIQSGG